MRLRVLDTTPGAGGLATEWEFDFPVFTVRELLRERISREVERYNRERPNVYHGLVQPAESERLLNGYRIRQFREIDAGEHYERAIRAFESGGFLVIAGGRQVESLDEPIDLQAAEDVEFIRLVPLIGG